MTEMPSIEGNEDRPKVWELRRGEHVVGILTENDWYQPPYRGYDFKPTGFYQKYAGLFEELMEANNSAWVNTDTENEDYVPKLPEKVEQFEQYLSDLKGEISALKLKMHPIDREAPDSRVILIFIDKDKAQIIPDFEHYNPFDYLEWDADWEG